MFNWIKRKPREKTEMEKLQEKRVVSSQRKLDCAEKAIALLNELEINRRLEDLGPEGLERRKANA